MAKNIGTINFYVNEALIESMPGAALKLGGLNKSPETTDQGLVHSTEEYVHSTVTVTVPVNEVDTIETLRSIDEQTGTFETNNGITYTITGLTAEMGADWEVKKGGMECRFFGNAAKPG